MRKSETVGINKRERERAKGYMEIRKAQKGAKEESKNGKSKKKDDNLCIVAVSLKR